MHLTPATRADEAKTRAAALAPSTTLLTVSSTLQETREAAGFRPKALLTGACFKTCTLSSLDGGAEDADTLQPTEAIEEAIAVFHWKEEILQLVLPDKTMRRQRQPQLERVPEVTTNKLGMGGASHGTAGVG